MSPLQINEWLEVEELNENMRKTSMDIQQFVFVARDAVKRLSDGIVFKIGNFVFVKNKNIFSSSLQTGTITYFSKHGMYVEITPQLIVEINELC